MCKEVGLKFQQGVVHILRNQYFLIIAQLVLRKLVKNENFDYVINDQTPPVINRKHLETPLG